MPKLIIVAGCNGAGKTTSSFIILPEILHCEEFVNADNIAAGISPLHPESVAFEAGRIMLTRIDQLMQAKADFAFETTLSTRSYVPLIKKAKDAGYTVTLCYFWLRSAQQAKNRVSSRVAKGGHHIPDDVITRRYGRSLHNLTALYTPIADKWLVYNNSDDEPTLVAEGERGYLKEIHQPHIWQLITKTYDVMEPTTPRMSELARQLTEALRKGVRKLVEHNAKLDQDMVYSDAQGNVQIVPAKEVLKKWEEEEKAAAGR
jgi:predicted ABC-type ATPase